MNIDVVVEQSGNEKKAVMNIQGEASSEIYLDFKNLEVLGTYPQNEISDLFLIGAAVYSLDRRILRKNATDAWTRIININISVSDTEKWYAVKSDLERCLNFLSGDKWSFSFFPLANNSSLEFETVSNVSEYGAVSLFSGGLDSLVGVINFLEDNPKQKLILVGHHDPHMPGPKTDQQRILNIIKKAYPERTFPFFVGVGTEHALETTLRSRSFLFITMGVFASCFLKEERTLMIPENGTIALNIPLTPSRRGTCSTRTAHPYYLQLFQRILDKLGIQTHLLNPLQMMTKGEVVELCRNPELLKHTAPISVSCGKRGHVVHWKRRDASECGKCMPCIYRRAALHKIGLDTEIYGNDICNGEVDPTKNNKGSNDFRAILAFIKKDYTSDAIAAKLACNSRLEYEKLSEYANMIVRTREEVKKLLKDKAIDSIKQFSGVDN